MDVKSQLYSYFIDLLNEISSISQDDSISLPNLDYGDLTISNLILQIKESTRMLINEKISQIISLNKNNKNYFQLENYIKKIEYDIKYYIRQYYEYKIQNDALEEKVRIYGLMQEEFEELKEKVKYEGGRFLNNERKENEIIILRQENTILKKEIAKFEKLQKLNETLKKDYIIKINYLQNEIEQLKKKLIEYQESTLSNKNNNKANKICKNESNDNNQSNNKTNNTTKNFHKLNKALINVNNINNKENTLSKWFSKLDIDGINNIMTNRGKKNPSLNYKNNLKNLFQKQTIFTNKRPSNYNIIKNLYMHSNNSIKYNYNINSSSMSTLNTNNVFTCNYNKIISNINHKNMRHALNKKTGSKKNKHSRKNNSISMKLEKDEDRSLSVNKLFRYKSDKKKINTIQFDKIKIIKHVANYPLSCKNKNTSKIKKFKNKKIGLSNNCIETKPKKNNSALIIRINSK